MCACVLPLVPYPAARPSSLHSNRTTSSNSNNNSHLTSPLEGKGMLLLSSSSAPIHLLLLSSSFAPFHLVSLIISQKINFFFSRKNVIKLVWFNFKPFSFLHWVESNKS